MFDTMTVSSGSVAGKTSGQEPVLVVRNLVKHFSLKPVGAPWGPKPVVRAVDDVSFSIGRDELVGLAGESGCGKSTVARLVLHLIPPTSGDIVFRGRNLASLGAPELRRLRPEMQMVFQDPYTSLNPRATVEEIITAPLSIHTKLGRTERQQQMFAMLERVGLARSHYQRYPHEFSGGQRQRIAIARALIMRPKFLVLDEPTSALDVSVQAVIINLLQDLQKELKLSCLFITHDLNLLRFMTDRLAIMYLGQIVELADSGSLFSGPLHPYSKALIASTPQPDPDRRRERNYLEGEIPSPTNPPTGCRFHNRCPEKLDARCETVEPSLVEAGGHMVRCHRYCS